MSPEDHRIERHTARVLLATAEGSTLLVRGQDPADLNRGHFYWTPGGGIANGEDAPTCARREVFEEVGHTIDPSNVGLSTIVATRSSTFPFDGNSVTQHEVYFFVDVVESFDARPHALSELEHRAIVAFEWLSPDEMRSSAAAVYPAELPDIIERVLATGRPALPLILS